MEGQPKKFSLTPEEAKQIQALQFARQAGFARKGATVKLATILVPLFAIGLLFAVDWIAFEDHMPFWFYFGLIGAYLLGTYTQVLVMWMSIADTTATRVQLDADKLL